VRVSGRRCPSWNPISSEATREDYKPAKEVLGHVRA